MMTAISLQMRWEAFVEDVVRLDSPEIDDAAIEKLLLIFLAGAAEASRYLAAGGDPVALDDEIESLVGDVH